MKRIIQVESDSIIGFGSSQEVATMAIVEVEYHPLEDSGGFEITKAKITVYTEVYNTHRGGKHLDSQGTAIQDDFIDTSDVLTRGEYKYEVTSDLWDYQVEPDEIGEIECETIEFNNYPKKNTLGLWVK